MQDEVVPPAGDDEGLREGDLAVQRARAGLGEGRAEKQPTPRRLRVREADLERDVLPRRDEELEHQERMFQAHCEKGGGEMNSVRAAWR